MNTRYGTSYFPTRGNAIRYYRAHEGKDAAAAVDRKLAAGEIHIGKPELKPGQTLSIEDCRYFVTDEGKKLWTHTDCLEKRCTHRQYYAQFVTPYIKQMVVSRIGLPALMASKDECLNDIPLHSWDCISEGSRSLFSIPAETEGNYGPEMAGKRMYSLAGGVCILKEAARQIIEENARLIAAAPELLDNARDNDNAFTQIIADLERAAEEIADANLGGPEHPALRFIRYAKVMALSRRGHARAAIAKATGTA